MRYGLLADIHANLAALEAVLADAAGRGIDRWVCLGDVVGYGPDPGPCIDRLQELGVETLQGNHEAALLGLPTPRFNRVAEEALAYTRRVLRPDQLQVVEGYGRQLVLEDDILCVHGSPFDRDEYLLLRREMKAVLQYSEQWVCVCGHTHQQFLFDGERIELGPLRQLLSRERRYLINPGSLGQPRDGDARAAYAVLESGDRVLHLLRVGYDVQATAERIRQEGLPEYLADRLLQGK